MPHITKEDEIDILKKYSGGSRTSELSAHYKIDRGTILDIVRRNGGEVRLQKNASGRPPSTIHLEDKIVQIYHEQKISQSQIAKIVGVSQSVISRVFRKNKLTPHKHQAPKRELSPFWKGGVTYRDGYVYEMSDEFPTMCQTTGYIPQHRLVMARYLGRSLYDFETVHHIDNNRKNNELSNLQLRIGNHGKYSAYVCDVCGSDKIKPIKLK